MSRMWWESVGRSRALLLAGAVVVLATPSARAFAQTSTVTGQVREASGGQPLPGAQVFIPGTNVGILTDAQGRYRLEGVPTGEVEVQVQMIGYRSDSRAVTVDAGQTVTLNFDLSVAAVSLEEVVVTATGEQRTRELGNAISTLDAGETLSKAPAVSLTDLLQGRITGVSIRPNSGSVGTASSIKIRGSSSLGLDNTPLIYVDGARIDNSNNINAGVGGQTFTRLNDINPEDIASVEVVKGPAAATLYGTEASGGVIRITTKKGRSGQTQYTFRAEQGFSWDATKWWSVAWNPARGLGLDLLTSSDANPDGYAAVKDTTYTLSLLEGAGPFASPFRTGRRQTYGATVRGGGQQTTYFLSGDYTDATGDLPSNDSRQYQVRANFDADPSEKVHVSVSNGFVSSHARLPENDNNLFGIIGNALGNPWNGPLTRPDPTSGGAPVQSCFIAFEASRSSGLPLEQTTADFCGSPYFISTNDKIFTRVNDQELERYTGSGTLNYRPVGWLTNRFTVGYDEHSSQLRNLVPVDPELPFFNDSRGFISRLDATTRDLTLEATSSVTANVTSALQSVTTVGAQWFRATTETTQAIGREFPAGSPSVGNSVTNEGDDAFFESRTLGLYAQEQLSWRDRLFVTPAVRFDDNSAFGSELGIKTYPRISVSWIASDAQWFPELFQTFKLRAAWGESGKQPGTTDALALLTPVAVAFRGANVLGVTSNRPGNDQLKPETGKELEVGFDASILNGRVGLQLTYYDQRTEDAIVQRPDAPSLGFPGNRFVNVAEITNRGIEAELDLTAVSRPDLTWLWSATISTNRNRVTKLPEPIIFGTQRHQQGYAFGSYFARPVTLAADGTPQVADDVAYLGQPTPTWEGSVSSTLGFFSRFELYALVDYAGGHKLLNGLEAFSCGLFGGGDQFGACPEIFGTDASGNPTNEALIKDAASAAGTEAPFVYDATFAKLRTLSLNVHLPERWLSLWGAHDATLTLSGQNLATWTKYPGTDPEVNFNNTDQVTREQLWTLPPARQFLVRLTLGL